jgi:phosphatidylethanolamine/phosphatidyl-N-methylethanolamine N-methyltransferase
MKGLFASDEMRFLRSFLADPLRIASPIPSGRRLARTIAAQIDPRPGGIVLELGPGTGPVTQAILESGVAPCDLVAIESDAEFAAQLREDFAGVRIVEGDAFAFPVLLHAAGLDAPLRTIVSGVPVLSRSLAVRRRLLADAIAALRPGSPFVQFSYGADPPLPQIDNVEVRRAAIVWHNIPPMHVWVYRATAPA